MAHVAGGLWARAKQVKVCLAVCREVRQKVALELLEADNAKGKRGELQNQLSQGTSVSGALSAVPTSAVSASQDSAFTVDVWDARDNAGAGAWDREDTTDSDDVREPTAKRARLPSASYRRQRKVVDMDAVVYDAQLMMVKGLESAGVPEAMWTNPHFIGGLAAVAKCGSFWKPPSRSTVQRKHRP